MSVLAVAPTPAFNVEKTENSIANTTEHNINTDHGTHLLMNYGQYNINIKQRGARLSQAFKQL